MQDRYNLMKLKLIKLLETVIIRNFEGTFMVMIKIFIVLITFLYS
jgi:hypothetical protein